MFYEILQFAPLFSLGYIDDLKKTFKKSINQRNLEQTKL